MILKVYSVFDNETKTYGNPVVVRNEVVFKRQLKNLLTSSQNPYKGCEDFFSVRLIANFDDETGLFFEKEGDSSFLLSSLLPAPVTIDQE